jgi:hypothetical protein
VTINGSGFTGATGVKFGNAAATNVHVVNDGQITATAPAGSGTVDVTVTTPSGTSQTGQSDKYTYNAPPPPPPPAVATQAPAASSGGNGASLSGLVDPNGQTTTAHWEYGLDPSYRGPGFSGNVFDQRTADQVVGSDTSSHVFSASVANLVPDALYHARLVATSPAGTTVSQDVTFMTAKAPAPPPPVLGKTENVAPVGKVFVQVNGQLVLLTQATQLPSGTVVDALKGSVTLTAAAGKGKSVTGTFGGAVFKLLQSGAGATKGLTTLDLVEGAFAGAPSYASCKAKAAGDGSAAARAARLSRRVLQTLHSSEHGGRFRTVGRYSAGTVRGTKWDTTDRCDGTLIVVHRGIVTVTDFVHHRTINVHAGQSYLAKAPKH